jgi:hypothetical protein
MIPANLQNPNLWRDSDLNSPPSQWEFLGADARWYFADLAPSPSPSYGQITFLGGDPLLASEDTVCYWEVLEVANSPGHLFGFDISAPGGGGLLANVPSNALGSGSFAIPAGTNLSNLLAESPLGGMYSGVIALYFTGTESSAFCVEVEWTAAISSEPITGYELYRSINGAPATLLASLGPDVLAYHDTGLTPGDEVTYYVIATTAIDATPSNSDTVIIGPPPELLFEVLDMPLQQDTDAESAPLVYLAAASTGPDFPGADVDVSRDGGSTWSPLASIDLPSIMGILTGDITTETSPDEVNTLQVQLQSYGGVLTTSTVDDLEYGNNAALVGDEWIQFATATDNGSGAYSLDYLLRGLEGTTNAAHTADERFVMLELGAQVLAPLEVSDIGETLTFRARMRGTTPYVTRSIVFAAVAGDGT